ncbi:MAG: IclR family transcriptional regulator [Clostridia bacterium]
MLRSFEKVFTLLDAFTLEEPEWSLADLARKVQMAKPTVHHIMSTLIKGGWIDRDLESKKFRLGVKLWEKGSLAINHMGVRERARPFIEALCAKSGETVRLGILDNVDPRWVIYIDRVETQHAVRASVSGEVRSPSYSVATGKALLAHRPEVVRRLAAQSLRAYTKGTLTNVAALEKDLAATRERGYSVNQSEFRNDVVGIAAPIWGHEGQVIAAVGISMPAYRAAPATVRRLAATVVATAGEISKRMGYVPSGGTHEKTVPQDPRRVPGAARAVRRGPKLPVPAHRGDRGLRSRGRE